MLKTSKTKMRALMALTVSANLLSQPLLAKAEETDPEALATNQAETSTEQVPETSQTEALPVAELATPETTVTANTPVAELSSQETSLETNQTEVPQETVAPVEAPLAETPAEIASQDDQASAPAPAVEVASEAVSESADTVETIVSATSAAAAEQATAAQDVIMPTYKYADPTDPYWQRITAMTGLQIPYVIINPSSGSGSARIENFAQQIAANSAAGIKSIGYINTKEFTRSHADLMSEVDNYANFYGSSNIAGIFFDEAEPGERQSDVDYMSGLYQAVKAKYPHMTVMANPGRTVTNAISPYADIWMTRETTADDYLNGYYEQLSDMEKDPASSKRTIHLIHSASPSQYDAIIALSRQRNAGYLMITDTSFLALPTDFESLVNRINSGGNGSAAPANQPATTSTQAGSTGFFRIPAGERTRAPRATATPAATTPLSNLGSLLVSDQANAINQDVTNNPVLTNSQVNDTSDSDNNTSQDRSDEDDNRNSDNRDTDNPSSQDDRNDTRDDSNPREEGDDRRQNDDSDENRSDASQNQEADDNSNSKSSSQEASDEDNQGSTKQATASRTDSQNQAENNSATYLAVLGGLALIGIGILVGRAVVKGKK